MERWRVFLHDTLQITGVIVIPLILSLNIRQVHFLKLDLMLFLYYSVFEKIQMDNYIISDNAFNFYEV